MSTVFRCLDLFTVSSQRVHFVFFRGRGVQEDNGPTGGPFRDVRSLAPGENFIMEIASHYFDLPRLWQPRGLKDSQGYDVRED